MAKKELPEKMFYSITEVAQYYNVNESTLRFWEKEFDLIAPKRSDNKRKIRSYTAQDVQNIGLIYYLLKEQGLTLSGAKEKLRKKPGKTENNYEILSRLRSTPQSRMLPTRQKREEKIPILKTVKTIYSDKYDLQ